MPPHPPKCSPGNTYIYTYMHTVPPRGNVALTRIFLSSGEFDSMVSRVHLLFYSRNCNGYTHVVLAMVQAKTTFVGDLHHYISSLLNTRGTRDLTNGCNS